MGRRTSIRGLRQLVQDTTPQIPAGTNLGLTNKTLISRVEQDTATLHAENPNLPVPVDLVTTLASGLDPHNSIAAADFQIPRVARARGMSESQVQQLVDVNTEYRQFGFLGEPRVNVLELNLALDANGSRKPESQENRDK